MFCQTELLQETNRLNRFALKLTRNKADADDLVQSTCLRALEKVHYFESGTNLFSWTSKIMFNIFITGCRHRTRFESKFDPEIVLKNVATNATQDTQSELISVQLAMLNLSREHQQVLDLICVRELRYDEVASLLGVAIGTVRSRLSRAREQIRSKMVMSSN
jgi:RNA polymerase sigma-70 factor (ECF subfamily)